MEPYNPFQDNYFDSNQEVGVSDDDFEVVNETPYPKVSVRKERLQNLSKKTNFPLSKSYEEKSVNHARSLAHISASVPVLNNTKTDNAGQFYSHSCPADLNDCYSDVGSDDNNSSLVHSSLPIIDFPSIHIPSSSSSQLSAPEESSPGDDKEVMPPPFETSFNPSRKHSSNSTGSWNELTGSELKYQNKGISHEGAILQHVPFSELKIVSATLSNCITILAIGESHSQEDIETVGWKLASSVGDKIKKESYFESVSKKSSEINKRPLVRLCSLVDVSFSTVLQKVSRLQELRCQGEENPIIDLCICFVKPEKIIRLDVKHLSMISKSINILPLVSKGTHVIDDMLGTLLAERLAASNISYYTLALGTGTIEVDCGSSVLDSSSILPCVTYKKLLEFPKFQMMFAWPGLRSSALQKIKKQPAVVSQPFSRISLFFLLGLTIFVMRLWHYFISLKNSSEERHYSADVVTHHNTILSDVFLSEKNV